MALEPLLPLGQLETGKRMGRQERGCAADHREEGRVRNSYLISESPWLLLWQHGLEGGQEQWETGRTAAMMG